ncbi:hypothetical protein RhoFasB10_03400 [Rhodococcus sp. B10]|uniref:Uncharacterized protein n=1 Tax=Rhodococcoides kyotonense TaxID=398843 RepID=A0A177Y663_9NOCA|nr:hypothetical protein [Rhodococcus sp. B10]OAK50992.1 hypothetical protein A3K89_14010 [Rhodococcus kyotonensis]
MNEWQAKLDVVREAHRHAVGRASTRLENASRRSPPDKPPSIEPAYESEPSFLLPANLDTRRVAPRPAADEPSTGWLV